MEPLWPVLNFHNATRARTHSETPPQLAELHEHPTYSSLTHQLLSKPCVRILIYLISRDVVFLYFRVFRGGERALRRVRSLSLRIQRSRSWSRWEEEEEDETRPSATSLTRIFG